MSVHRLQAGHLHLEPDDAGAAAQDGYGTAGEGDADRDAEAAS